MLWSPTNIVVFKMTGKKFTTFGISQKYAISSCLCKQIKVVQTKRMSLKAKISNSYNPKKYRNYED